MKGREFAAMVKHNQAVVSSKMDAGGSADTSRSRRVLAANLEHEHDVSTHYKAMDLSSLHPLARSLHDPSQHTKAAHGGERYHVSPHFSSGIDQPFDQTAGYPATHHLGTSGRAIRQQDRPGSMAELSAQRGLRSSMSFGKIPASGQRHGCEYIARPRKQHRDFQPRPARALSEEQVRSFKAENSAIGARMDRINQVFAPFFLQITLAGDIR